MYCTQCGKEIRDLDRFCGQCGAATGVAGPGAGPTSYAPPPGPPKKLMLSRADRKVGGVCAGFADYLGWDVTIVRLLFLCGVVYSVGLALVAYLIAWIVIPAPAVTYAPQAVSSVPAVRTA